MERRLEANWRAVRARIDSACKACGRDSSEVELLAVTKKVGTRLAADLSRLGQLSLGENRASEFERKTHLLEEHNLSPQWHFIGSLQRNKARRVVRLAHTIHSVDSIRLLTSLEGSAADEDVRPSLYLQVNVSHENEKHGFDAEELPAAVEFAASCEHLKLVGLMGMGPRLQGADDATRRAGALASFERLTELGDSLPGDAFANGKPRYSMGMSGDLEEAIRAGSNVVRVGSALFEGLENLTEEIA